jgi:hypothetical protein
MSHQSQRLKKLLKKARCTAKGSLRKEFCTKKSHLFFKFFRVKLYYFNNESNQYVDRGIGNLHIKPTSDGTKKQLIIRADTSLGWLL